MDKKNEIVKFREYKKECDKIRIEEDGIYKREKTMYGEVRRVYTE
jgi:hypothetical protein